MPSRFCSAHTVNRSSRSAICYAVAADQTGSSCIGACIYALSTGAKRGACSINPTIVNAANSLSAWPRSSSARSLLGRPPRRLARPCHWRESTTWVQNCCCICQPAPPTCSRQRPAPPSSLAAFCLPADAQQPPLNVGRAMAACQSVWSSAGAGAAAAAAGAQAPQHLSLSLANCTLSPAPPHCLQYYKNFSAFKEGVEGFRGRLQQLLTALPVSALALTNSAAMPEATL